MIQLYRMKREDTGSEYNLRCDDALLAARKVGKGPPKIGDQFAAISKLDGSIYIETLIHIGKRGTASTTKTWVMRSTALGVNPDQINDQMAADAENGIPVEFDRNSGEAVFRSQKQFERYASYYGFRGVGSSGNGGPQPMDDEERQRKGLPMLAHTDDGEFLSYD